MFETITHQGHIYTVGFLTPRGPLAHGAHGYIYLNELPWVACSGTWDKVPLDTHRDNRLLRIKGIAEGQFILGDYLGNSYGVEKSRYLEWLWATPLPEPQLVLKSIGSPARIKTTFIPLTPQMLESLRNPRKVSKPHVEDILGNQYQREDFL